jgi:serine/threonine-protein kinase
MTHVGALLADRYRIEALLGAGGMATVHRATDLRLDRQVAVKVLLPNLAHEASITERFDREARALAAVDHPAIVAIHDVDPGDLATGREPFFVMELCEGGSLAERRAAAGRLPPDEIVPIAVRIAEGLTALHERGIVHRDVKPHNILVCASGPKLGDFGIARFDSRYGKDTLTATGTAPATVGYAAPELLSGERATPASDVYGLASVVYEAITGARPRPADSLAEAVDRRFRPPALPSSIEPDLGTAFDAALTVALSADPTQRPDVSTLATQLESALIAWARYGSRSDASIGLVPVAAPVAGVPPDPEAATVVVDTDGLASAGPLAIMDLVRDIELDRVWIRSVAQKIRSADWQPIARVVTAGAAVILLVVVVGQLATGLSPGGSADPSLPAASSADLPAVSATLSPAPTEAPPSDPVDAALEEIRELTADVRGGEGGNFRKEIDEVSRALADGEQDKARAEARDLAKRIDELVEKERVVGETADRLQDAARTLLDALGAGGDDDD